MFHGISGSLGTLTDADEVLESLTPPADTSAVERAVAAEPTCRDWSADLEGIRRELAVLDAMQPSTGGVDARVTVLEGLVARLEVLTAAIQETASVRAEISALEKLFWTAEAPVREDPSPTGYAKVLTTTVSLTAGNETVILCNAVGGAIVITLPAAAVAINRVYHVKKIDASAYTVTATPAGAETIDGAATMVLSTPNEDMHIVSSGAAWFIL